MLLVNLLMAICEANITEALHNIHYDIIVKMLCSRLFVMNHLCTNCTRNSIGIQNTGINADSS